MMEKVNPEGMTVKDLQATLTFYEKDFGLQVRQRWEHDKKRGASTLIFEK